MDGGRRACLSSAFYDHPTLRQKNVDREARVRFQGHALQEAGAQRPASACLFPRWM